MPRKSNTHLFSALDERHYKRYLGKVLTELVDYMDIAIWELDDAFTIVSCNHKALSVYGHDIIGKYCYLVATCSRTSCPDCPAKNVQRTRKPHHAELSHRGIKGNVLHVEHFATPILEEDKSLAGILVLLFDVTERKKAEEELEQHKEKLEQIAREKAAALAKSEGKFAVAFDASPDAININRLEDGLYVEVNTGFTDLTGFTFADVSGKTSKEIDIWYDPADRQRLVQKLNKHGYCENLEARFRRKDGSVATGLMSARVISLNDEPHIISITRDISNLKEMENQIAGQQRLFETMFNAIEDGIVITDTQRRIQLVNDGMTEAFGYLREELLGMTTEILYADKEEYLQAGTRVFNADLDVTSNKYTKRYRHKSGREFHASTFAAKLFDRKGEWIGNLGIMRDITEQLKNEKDRDTLIEAVQQVGEAIVITDISGTIEFVNPAFEEITGYTKDEVIGKNPNILKSGKHDDAFYRGLWETIASGKTFSGRMVNKRKDGSEYTEEVTISPIISVDDQIVNYIGVKRDISRQLVMEQQLRQAQKMEAIGRLTGGVAHDFNNMLGVIMGYAEMALDNIPKEDKIYGDLLAIYDAAERSGAIVRQLLAFSRLQTIAPKTLDLSITVAGMLNILRRLIGEDIRLEWFPCSSPLTVKMDPSQIDQILANLCVNSKDAIKNHGCITIETGITVFDEMYCSEHVGSQPGTYAMLAVSDDGTGIEEKNLERVYEPFFTTKELGRGTGLGLSTVYGIVKQNDGFINIYSELGQGTTVKVYFPLCNENIEHNEMNFQQPQAQTGDEKILIVEDDDAIRDMVQMMVSSLGYTAFTAETPHQAIEMVMEGDRTVDLLLTDVVMPQMNGRELSNRLQQSIPSLKCLYMSGYTSNVIANNSILGEDIYFVQKPFSRDLLAQKIREALEEKRSTN